MTSVHASLAPSRRPGSASAICWREMLQVALDGWRPGDYGVEALIDRVEGAR